MTEPPAAAAAPLRTYDDQGRPLSEVPMVNGVVHGLYRLWQEGHPAMDLPFVQGKPEGVGVWYDPQGRVLMRVTFVAGRKHGPAEIWQNGRLTARLTYADDRPDGMVTVEQAAGAPPQAELPHQAGLPHGLATYRSETGAVVRQEHWQAGDRHGVQQDFDPTGRVAAQRSFTQGVADGPETAYAPGTAVPQRVRWWQGGRLVGQQIFDAKGTELRREGQIGTVPADPAAGAGSPAPAALIGRLKSLLGGGGS